MTLGEEVGILFLISTDTVVLFRFMYENPVTSYIKVETHGFSDDISFFIYNPPPYNPLPDLVSVPPVLVTRPLNFSSYVRPGLSNQGP